LPPSVSTAGGQATKGSRPVPGRNIFACKASSAGRGAAPVTSPRAAARRMGAVAPGLHPHAQRSWPGGAMPNHFLCSLKLRLAVVGHRARREAMSEPALVRARLGRASGRALPSLPEWITREACSEMLWAGEAATAHKGKVVGPNGSSSVGPGHLATILWPQSRVPCRVSAARPMAP